MIKKAVGGIVMTERQWDVGWRQPNRGGRKSLRGNYKSWCRVCSSEVLVSLKSWDSLEMMLVDKVETVIIDKESKKCLTVSGECMVEKKEG